jgi:hypothetical protein
MRMDRLITVVGCHAEGEVGRVITGGVLPPPGKTLFDQKRYLETEADDLRRFLLFEPRGSMFVHANLIVPPTRPGADAGFIRPCLDYGLSSVQPRSERSISPRVYPFRYVVSSALGKPRQAKITGVVNHV